MAEKQKTANELLLDAIIRHQTYLLRYSGSVRNRMVDILAATEQDIAMRIRDKLANSTGLTTPVEVRRMQALIASIDKIRIGAWQDASSWWDEQMKNLSYAEPIAVQAMLAASAPVLVLATVARRFRAARHDTAPVGEPRVLAGSSGPVNRPGSGSRLNSRLKICRKKGAAGGSGNTGARVSGW